MCGDRTGNPGPSRLLVLALLLDRRFDGPLDLAVEPRLLSKCVQHLAGLGTLAAPQEEDRGDLDAPIDNMLIRDDRFEGVSITAANIDNILLLENRPEITYDLMGGTVLSNTQSVPGTGGSITLSYKDSSYRIDISPFTGKLTVVEE